ncbi:MAG: glycosyltransferase family 1 protein, partial [Sphingobacteriales bacterium]
PSWWKQTGKDVRVLQELDALVVLSSEAYHYFKSKVKGQVYLIPHAVDTKFFCPPQNDSEIKTTRILFVGNWLRDFQAFTSGIESILRLKNNIIVDVVLPFIPDQSHPLFRLMKYTNINWHRNITDDKLKQFYQQSTCLYLPLIDCTANNALLEAAAAGLPIITNNCGGVIDYLDANLVHLVESGNEAGLLKAFEFCISDSTTKIARAQAGKQSKLIHEKFGVDVISKALLDLYTSL